MVNTYVALQLSVQTGRHEPSDAASEGIDHEAGGVHRAVAVDIEQPQQGHQDDQHQRCENLGAVANNSAEDGFERGVAEYIRMDDFPTVVLVGFCTVVSESKITLE